MLLGYNLLNSINYIYAKIYGVKAIGRSLEIVQYFSIKNNLSLRTFKKISFPDLRIKEKD